MLMQFEQDQKENKKNFESSLVKKIQDVFDDSSLYKNDQIQQLVEKNEKGYVRIEQMLCTNTLSEVFQDQQLNYIHKELIENVVKSHSKKLVCRNGRIRRLVPFINQIKLHSVKPIYIDNLPIDFTEEAVWSALCEYTTLYKIDYDYKNRGCFVYCQNSLPILEMRGKQRLWESQSIYTNEQVQKMQKKVQKLEWSAEQRLYSSFSDKNELYREESEESEEKFRKKKVKTSEMQAQFNNSALLSFISL